MFRTYQPSRTTAGAGQRIRIALGARACVVVLLGAYPLVNAAAEPGAPSRTAAHQAAAAPAAALPDQAARQTAPQAAGAQDPALQATVVCASSPGGRQHCPADTSAGVLLLRSTGPEACLLGRNWGYDDTGIWVADGCSGEFAAGQLVPVGVEAEAPAQAEPPPERIESWGEFEPGDGFLIGRNSVGELSISAYALVRYVNQLPPDQTFTDHLGNEHPVKARQDFFAHRAIVFLRGWIGLPKLVYNFILWTVNTTDQDALFGNLGYQFTRRFSLYGGLNGTPGTRSLQGSHPYWLGHDRVMADEFFRPYFAHGVWAQGEVLPGFWYNAGFFNNNSSLGITAAQLDRRFSTGASVWWMPTTHEFGPRGSYGDWEMHEELATRFGVSTAQGREGPYLDPATDAPDNTTLKLADGLNVFDTGSLAPGVTVQEVDYRLLSIDAGVKYRGLFLQTEIYTRWLDNFAADGALPVDSIVDQGFYVQGSFFPWPQKLEVYGVTSQIFGDADAGFGDSSEYIIGANFYPANSRDYRLNVQVIDVNRSPVGSTFGYYTAGQDGTTVATGFSVFF